MTAYLPGREVRRLTTGVHPRGLSHRVSREEVQVLVVVRETVEVDEWDSRATYDPPRPGERDYHVEGGGLQGRGAERQRRVVAAHHQSDVAPLPAPVRVVPYARGDEIPGRLEGPHVRGTYRGEWGPG